MTEPAADIHSTLRHILERLETRHRRSWIEVTCAIILALTTISSAWCAYQSKLWGQVQGSKAGAAGHALANSSEDRLAAMQFREFEASMFVEIFKSKADGDDKTATFLADRLPPPTRAAYNAWLETEPMTNPEAPRSPYVMPQYVQPQLEEAKKQEAIAADHQVESRAAGRASDTYVMLTVQFATVLFFGGIGGSFESRMLRNVMFVIALALFLVTLSALVTMPVTWD